MDLDTTLRSWRPPFSMFTIGLLAAVSAVACSSTTAAPGSVDASAVEAAEPVDYCADEAAFAERCVTEQDCRSDFNAQCAKRNAFYGDGYKAAFHACAAKADCSNAGVDSECVAVALKKRRPTAAQQKLVDEFCAACAAGGKSVREEGVACAGNVTVGTGRTLGPYVLSLADSSAETVRADCIEPAKQQFPNDYPNCENTFLNCVGEHLAEAPPSCR